MAEIFVSYRTDDASYAAADIHARLVRRFGSEQVFRDCNSMPPGTVYPPAIRAALARCDVLVAVIGPGWLNAVDGGGRRRIDDPGDWVRREITQALRRPIPVVPVLLDGAGMPMVEELPTEICALALCQATWVRHRDLEHDVVALADGLALLVPGLEPARDRGRWATRARRRLARRGGAAGAVERGTAADRARPVPDPPGGGNVRTAPSARAGDPAGAAGPAGDAVPGPRAPRATPAPSAEAAAGQFAEAHRQLPRIAAEAGPGAAVRALRDLLSEAVDALGYEHALVLTFRHDLAHWTDRAGDPVTAQRLFDEAWRERARVLGGNHPDTNRTRAARDDWTLARRVRLASR